VIQILKISDDFQVSVEAHASFAPVLEAKVDQIWHEARKNNSSLFDGTALAVRSFSAHSVQCITVPYKYFFAQQQDVELNGIEKLLLAGVSGVVRFGQAVLFGKRGPFVTQYPGAFELVPSGSLPAGSISTTIDYRQHLLDELHEETGIDRSHVADVAPLFLLVDRADGVVDICLSVQLACDPMQQCDLSSNEYDSLKTAPIASLRQIASATPSSWVPTSRAILSHLDDSFVSSMLPEG
jgi:hypothetical protein